MSCKRIEWSRRCGASGICPRGLATSVEVTDGVDIPGEQVCGRRVANQPDTKSLLFRLRLLTSRPGTSPGHSTSAPQGDSDRNKVRFCGIALDNALPMRYTDRNTDLFSLRLPGRRGRETGGGGRGAGKSGRVRSRAPAADT